MDEVLNHILIKLDSLEKGQQALEKGQQKLEKGQQEFRAEVRSEFEKVQRKLDTIYSQVAHNTEQEVRLNEVIARVNEHDTDIRLIKKIVSNQ